MIILDANAVLRYLLNDNEEMASEVEEVIKSGSAYVTIEIIAEVTYVLKGVYSVSRKDIGTVLTEKFLPEVNSEHSDVLKLGLRTYAENNIDFVDSILYAYHVINGYEIKTFDKKLSKLMDHAGNQGSVTWNA